MKKIFLALFLIAIISCKDGIKINTQKPDSATTETKKDEENDFEAFKSAIEVGDWDYVKKYTKFPLNTESWIAWKYVTDTILDGDDDIALRVEDFDANTDRMFPLAFSESIKNVSLDEILKVPDILTTPRITAEDGRIYETECGYDEDMKWLFFYFKEIKEELTDEEKEMMGEDPDEYASRPLDDIRYYFEIDKNKKIRLVQVDAYK